MAKRLSAPGLKFGGRFTVRRPASIERDVAPPRTTKTVAHEMAAKRVGVPSKTEG